MNRYQDIVEYFQTIAQREANILHGVGGRVAFVKSDVMDILALQGQKLAPIFMVVGYQPEGIDRGSGSYSFADKEKSSRVYNINVAVFKESDIQNIDATYQTNNALDEIADNIFALMEEDRLDAFDDGDKDAICFHRDMDLNVRIYKTAILGNRKALGIILNFTWNFCR